METEMFCLSLSVECHTSKDLWMYVSHVYLSFCKLTSLSIWILFLLLALWIQIKEENVCVFSGSRTSRRLSRSPVGSGWRDGHSGLHREHGSGKSVSVLQRHRYSSLILNCWFHVFWDVSSFCLLASQCVSASSLCSVRSLTWWVQIQSAMISQAGSVRSRTTRLSLTPVPSCRTPQCKRLQMITDVHTAADDL